VPAACQVLGFAISKEQEIFPAASQRYGVRPEKARTLSEDLREHAALAEREFLIPNMVCEGCAEKIRTALQSVPGVQEVKSKVSQKHVCVRYEPSKVQDSRLREVLEKAGFSAIEA